MSQMHGETAIPMKREQVLAVLRQERETLRTRYGARDIALFGSVARNQATNTSDVDILIDFDRPISLFGLAAVQQYLQTALGGTTVDVVPRDCIYPELAPSILAGAIHVA